MAIRVPEELNPSNQVGELLAIKETVEVAPANAPLRILSDSKYAIDGLTKNLQRWQDEGFHTVANGTLFELTAAKIRTRKAPTEFVWVKGHSGVAGNEAADVLAGEGSRKPDNYNLNVTVDSALVLPGARLQAMTQSKAYKIIRKIKMEKPTYQALLNRRETSQNVAAAKEAATGADGEVPTTGKIWKSTRNKDISRSIRFFLWMLIHGAYKVGEYWDSIPNHAYRGQCPQCGTYESMNHILTECGVPGQKEVWDIASEMWRLKTGGDLRPTLSQIMAGGAIKLGDPGTTRLHRILITESAHLVWKLRNERRIQKKNPSALHAIRNRWLKVVNNRLAIDCAMTNKYKYEKKALKISLVKKTWEKTLKDERMLARDWPKTVGVLVGVG
ncbi:ribonuclease H-like protein [Mycena alexandri]|uniref:ribonuclease H n=1 Tax=Mycena alexandri TaxID=1745969 RepID=A0AAD6T693_9AGAR|nr:ribonuclease H-like protein [Mycena alexandri]